MFGILLVGVFLSTIQGSQGYDIPDSVKVAVENLVELAVNVDTILPALGFQNDNPKEPNTKRYYHMKWDSMMTVKYADLQNSSAGIEIEWTTFFSAAHAQIYLTVVVEEDRLSFTGVLDSRAKWYREGPNRFTLEQIRVGTLWRNRLAVERQTSRNVELVYSVSWVSANLRDAVIRIGNGKGISLDKLEMVNDHKGQAIIVLDILDTLTGAAMVDFELREDYAYLNAEMVNSTLKGTLLRIKMSELENSILLDFAGSPRFQIVGEAVDGQLLAYLYTQDTYQLEITSESTAYYDEKTLKVKLKFNFVDIFTAAMFLYREHLEMNIKMDRMIHTHIDRHLSGFRGWCPSWQTCGLPRVKYNKMEDPFLIDVSFKHSDVKNLNVTFHGEHVWNFKAIGTKTNAHARLERNILEVAFSKDETQLFDMKTTHSVLETKMEAKCEYLGQKYNFYLQFEARGNKAQFSTGIIHSNLNYGFKVTTMPKYIYLLARLGYRGECRGQLSFAHVDGGEVAHLRCNGVTNLVANYQPLDRDGGFAIQIEGDHDLFHFGGRSRPGGEVGLAFRFTPSVGGGYSADVNLKWGPLSNYYVSDENDVEYSVTEYLAVNMDVKPSNDFVLTGTLEHLGDGNNGDKNISLNMFYLTADGTFTSQSGNLVLLANYNSSSMGKGNLKVEVDAGLGNLNLHHMPEGSEPNQVVMISGDGVLEKIDVDWSDALKFSWNSTHERSKISSFLLKYSFPQNQSNVLCRTIHTFTNFVCPIQLYEGLDIIISLSNSGIDGYLDVDSYMEEKFNGEMIWKFLGIQVNRPLATCSDSHCFDLVFDVKSVSDGVQRNMDGRYR